MCDFSLLNSKFKKKTLNSRRVDNLQKVAKCIFLNVLVLDMKQTSLSLSLTTLEYLLEVCRLERQKETRDSEQCLFDLVCGKSEQGRKDKRDSSVHTRISVMSSRM
jgi:hypothetical protein